jgi:hypothetical protein
VRLLQAYFAASFLVSCDVAIIGPAFRDLWRESGIAVIFRNFGDAGFPFSHVLRRSCGYKLANDGGGTLDQSSTIWATDRLPQP